MGRQWLQYNNLLLGEKEDFTSVPGAKLSSLHRPHQQQHTSRKGVEQGYPMGYVHDALTSTQGGTYEALQQADGGREQQRAPLLRATTSRNEGGRDRFRPPFIRIGNGFAASAQGAGIGEGGGRSGKLGLLSLEKGGAGDEWLPDRLLPGLCRDRDRHCIKCLFCLEAVERSTFRLQVRWFPSRPPAKSAL